MDKDELKEIITNLPDSSPKLLEYLKLAREKGWQDIIDMIAVKLGLKEAKKEKKKVQVKRLNTKKVNNSWDYSVDFNEAKKTLVSVYKQAYDINDTATEVYTAILLIQLINGMRVREAIRAFKTFLETKEREFQLQAQKHGNPRHVVIPDVIRYKETYRFVLDIDDEKLRHRVKQFAKRKLGINTHSLRYALISYLAKNGIAPSIIAKITGHKRLDRIVTYTESKEALEILRRLSE